ncbi:hypothetical protein HETIRDRAFT_326331 [Heterobasidion irregulare TC 32-1]|uniref:Uncharacterized protein n=1 Tax=Heterobasidion irregulare (strain TC 32-1) TaxID=747525 RepID=W4JXS5_HETIT|nr:uncharacterized protein HETIRDRAFT_326331 [Heterobasidion irregulare TC 32-1]ETW78372.1 hypothetical protein HETIRDRAFT_326331 [Heterobasidion irregulare TC 32-1]
MPKRRQLISSFIKNLGNRAKKGQGIFPEQKKNIPVGERGIEGCFIRNYLAIVGTQQSCKSATRRMTEGVSELSLSQGMESLAPRVEAESRSLEPPSNLDLHDKASQMKESTNSGTFLGLPLIEEAHAAICHLKQILHPPHWSRKGHKPFIGDELLRRWLEMMLMFLTAYADKK